MILTIATITAILTLQSVLCGTVQEQMMSYRKGNGSESNISLIRERSSSGNDFINVQEHFFWNHRWKFGFDSKRIARGRKCQSNIGSISWFLTYALFIFQHVYEMFTNFA